MPVEIRELVIKAVITAKSVPDPYGIAGTTEADAESKVAVASKDPEDRIHPQPATIEEDFIQECVRQVLKILQRQKER